MGSAAAMNASIKANTELRKRRRNIFKKGKVQLSNNDFNLQPLSKEANAQIRASRNLKIIREQYHKRIVGVLVLIPVLVFLQFLLKLLINWL